jgi:predicted phosphodiesterase
MMNMELITLEEKPIMALGDLHGRFELLTIELKSNYKLRNCNLLICGDIGMGFSRREYYESTFKALNKTLGQYKVNLYMFRGNHDDPSYFQGPNEKYPNIVLLKDYTILHNSKRTILCVGGGLSIDRLLRLRDYEQRKAQYSAVMSFLPKEEVEKLVLPSYWENELPVFNEEIAEELRKLSDTVHIDTIATHTSPSFCYKRDKDGVDYWMKLDSGLRDDLERERATMDELRQCVRECGFPVRDWVYGHFHGHNEEVIDGITFTALLNCDKAFDIKGLSL